MMGRSFLTSHRKLKSHCKPQIVHQNLGKSDPHLLLRRHQGTREYAANRAISFCILPGTTQTLAVFKMPSLVTGSVVTTNCSSLSFNMVYTASHAGVLGTSASVTLSVVITTLASFSGTSPRYCRAKE